MWPYLHDVAISSLLFLKKHSLDLKTSIYVLNPDMIFYFIIPIMILFILLFDVLLSVIVRDQIFVSLEII